MRGRLSQLKNVRSTDFGVDVGSITTLMIMIIKRQMREKITLTTVIFW